MFMLTLALKASMVVAKGRIVWTIVCFGACEKAEERMHMRIMQ